MKSLKQNVEKMIRNLPDDSTIEDIQYHIYVRQKVARGRQAARAGDVVPAEEVERRLARWLDK